MTTPDAEDASPSPDYSGDQDGSDMADSTPNPKDHHLNGDQSPTQAQQTKSSNAKDPQRPRRKKARRACFACQRAHLTCGDERPCQRCIKRGLQDACHDGIRKKAKYLHDTPNEALMPGVGGHYPHINAGQPASALPVAVTMAQHGNYFPQTQQQAYNVYPNSSQGQMPPPMQEASAMNSFSSQQPPISPYAQNPNQQTPPMQGMPNAMQQNQQSNPQMQGYGGALFDPSDPALFNFDISSLNFGNHYGALEFGMLGHMSSGAAETPPETSSVMNPMNQAASIYGGPMSAASGSSENLAMGTGFNYGSDGIASTDWQNHQRQGSMSHNIQTPNNTPATTTMDASVIRDGQDGMPLAYAVGAGPGSLASASPAASVQEGAAGFDGSPMSPAYFATPSQQQHQQQMLNQRQHLHRQHQQHQQQQQQQQQQQLQQQQQQQQQNQQQASQREQNATTLNTSPLAHRRRRRDPSEIYESVTSPYGYTDGFHGLQSLLKQRFSTQKRLRIAQALSSIRPSFIACTSKLNTADLIFMEKCFQRTLCQYEDFINSYGTPTIICRRTGQVAAVSQEFTLLTGWRKDVLLGYEPNRNVNMGGTSTSTAQSGAVSRDSRGGTGINTPAEPSSVPVTEAKPVYLAELLDDSSVCEFYEDFAKLAFVAPRARAQRNCKLIRYMEAPQQAGKESQGDVKMEEEGARYSGGGAVVKLENAGDVSGKTGAGAMRPGSKDGLIPCCFCWSVKRDVFEVPMLIVMNFLPITQQLG